MVVLGVAGRGIGKVQRRGWQSLLSNKWKNRGERMVGGKRESYRCLGMASPPFFHLLFSLSAEDQLMLWLEFWAGPIRLGLDLGLNFSKNPGSKPQK